MNRGAAPAYTPEFVERGYNNRAAVPDHPRWLAYYPRASAEARAALAPKTDLRYGSGPKETLDLFVPTAPRTRHVRVHSRRLLARVRQERLLVRRDPVRRRRAWRSPWSTTIFVPTCRSPRSSRSVGARCAGSSARVRRTARIPAASWSAGIQPADTLRRCCSRPIGRNTASPSHRSPEAFRYRACTISRRWCNSRRTTPI